MGADPAVRPFGEVMEQDDGLSVRVQGPDGVGHVRIGHRHAHAAYVEQRLEAVPAGGACEPVQLALTHVAEQADALGPALLPSGDVLPRVEQGLPAVGAEHPHRGLLFLLAFS